MKTPTTKTKPKSISLTDEYEQLAQQIAETLKAKKHNMLSASGKVNMSKLVRYMLIQQARQLKLDTPDVIVGSWGHALMKSDTSD